MQSKECLADGFTRPYHRLEHCNWHSANNGTYRALKVNVNLSLVAIPAETRTRLVT